MAEPSSFSVEVNVHPVLGVAVSNLDVVLPRVNVQVSPDWVQVNVPGHRNLVPYGDAISYLCPVLVSYKCSPVRL